MVWNSEEMYFDSRQRQDILWTYLVSYTNGIVKNTNIYNYCSTKLNKYE
jgi:hypothetical protein